MSGHGDGVLRMDAERKALVESLVTHCIRCKVPYGEFGCTHAAPTAEKLLTSVFRCASVTLGMRSATGRRLAVSERQDRAAAYVQRLIELAKAWGWNETASDIAALVKYLDEGSSQMSEATKAHAAAWGRE